jgi:hypothetical protein
MTYETAIGMLRVAQTGDQMLQVLDSIVTGFDYVESPQIEQALTGGLHRSIAAVPTLEPMEF